MPKLILVNNDDELDNALKQDYVDIIGANADLMNKDNVKKRMITIKISMFGL